MTNTYDDEDPLPIKVYEELRCIRCSLERLLQAISRQHFLDYQLEKFSEHYKTKKERVK